MSTLTSHQDFKDAKDTENARVTVIGKEVSNEDDLLAYEIDPAEEAALLRTLDWHIAPVVMILYLIAFLDRSNIGNAAVAGMTVDLNLPTNGLSVATSIFYATYVTMETPFTTVMKSVKASRLIPTVVILWGVTILASAWMRNYAGLIVTRLVLGLLESALTPCLFLWLTVYYKRSELGKRNAFMFMSAALSGVVGGLVAGGLIKMEGLGGLRGWQWLYAIEGAITILIGIGACFVVPDSYNDARFLTERQKFLMKVRDVQAGEYMGNMDFSWLEVRKAFTDPAIYFSGLAQFGFDTCLYGFSTFLVVIVNSFGFGKIESQLMTAPIYAFGAAYYFVAAVISDRFAMRYWIILPSAMISAVGYVLLVAVQMNLGVKLFACFLVAAGVYAAVGLHVTFLSINNAGFRKRSVAVGMQQSLGNSGGIIAGQIYRSIDKPNYRLGHAVSLGAMVWGMFFLTLEHRTYQARNATKVAMSEKDKDQMDQAGITGDAHWSFTYAA